MVLPYNEVGFSAALSVSVENGQAANEHRKSTEHERGPENRPDSHIRPFHPSSEEDRNHRDYRFRHRCADRCQDAACGRLGKSEPHTEPFYAVREHLAAEEYDHQTEHKQKNDRDG